ncbi:MAG: Ig-like domain-containing protein, partial [Leptothrix sp. (in: b-proteobacteria)]
ITALRQLPGNATLDGRGTTTVVIDTGIDVDHPFFGPDLNGNGVDDRIVYQWDFANNDADASDMNGHGSNVASIIGSQDGSYYGVAPGTNLIVLKVFSDTGVGTFGYLEQALQWVLAHREAYHIDVVNMSLGDNGNWTDSFSRYGIGDELAALAQTDTIMVAAAGNNYLQFGKMGVAYPGSDPAVIAVGATWAANFGGPWTVSTGATNYTTGADQIAAFSQRSTDLVDTFAPGARFNGANASGGITTMQGTSQAAAFVSGAAALAQQIAQRTLGRDLSTGEFAQLLRHTGDLIMDGDDEVDNVVNTGEKFPRLDMVKLADAIAHLGDSTPGAGGNTGGGSPAAPLALQGASGVYNVQLSAGSALTGREFGNFQLGKAAGVVYGDTDRSGSLGAGEQGLGGITVFLDDNGNGLLDAGEHSVISAADGSFSFDALHAGATTLRVLAPAGYVPTVPDALQFNVTSGLNASGLNIGLAPVNHAPVGQPDHYSTRPGQLLTIAAPGVLGNDSDADGDTLHVTAIDPSGLQGSIAQFADGSLQFTPTAGFSGSTSFLYYLSDGVGGTASATVTIDVVNHAPVAGADVFTVHAGQVLNVAAPGVLGNDSDADGDALHVTAIDPSGLQGSIAQFADGSLQFTPTAGFSGDTGFTYYIADAYGGTAQGTVTIHVLPPTLVANDDTVTIDEDTVARVDVLANDTVGVGASLSLGTAQHGTVALAQDGRVVYTPTADFNGDDQFAYTVHSADGASASATVRVHVNPVNDAPVFDAIANQVVAEDGTLSLDLHAHDVDDTRLRYALLQGPGGMTLDPDSGHLSWQASDLPAQTVRVQVSDPSGASDVRQFTVSVQLGRLVVTAFE